MTTTHNKPVALVTGANKGIGLQVAKDIAAHGFTVLLGSRNLKAGETAAQSVAEDARALQLDVTDQASVIAAAERIRNEFGRLDVLVNNAGISHAGEPGRSPEEIVASGTPGVASLDEVRALYETNVFGSIAVTQAMLPLLQEAPAGRIVNMSSSSGSLTLNSDPDYPVRAVFGIYSSTKTALNAITLGLAIELESMPIKVNAACPGFTATDLNNFAGTRTVEQGAREAVRLALIGAAVRRAPFRTRTARSRGDPFSTHHRTAVQDHDSPITGHLWRRPAGLARGGHAGIEHSLHNRSLSIGGGA
jgi:NAD(P)-dependent dehydrogenase (short-subunit alcohol dehydrogenase family)